jgi:hypothetical protein
MAGLTGEQIASLTTRGPDDGCWSEDGQRALIAMVVALHDHDDSDDHLWNRLSEYFDQRQLFDVLLLAGWYHAIAYVARATRAELDRMRSPTSASTRREGRTVGQL